MDPDAALERLRTWAKSYDRGTCEDPACSDAVDALDGLDSWMQRGGYPPTAWKTTTDDQP